MHTALVPHLAACVLLVLAGAAKLRRPAATAQALRTQGLPSSLPLVRALGAGEVVVALTALAGVPAGAFAVALAYLAFTGFVLLGLLRGRSLSSCGCFGEPDLPATWTHVAVTALAAVASGSIALTGGAGLPQVLALPLLVAVAAVAATALTTWLALLTLTALPRVVAAGRLTRPAAPSTSPRRTTA